MFDYAFKDVVSKATEDLAESEDSLHATAEANGTTKLSSGMNKFFTTSSIRGIIRAIAVRMLLRGESQEDTRAKLNDLIEQVRRTGDIDAATAGRLKTMSYDAINQQCSPITYCDTFSMYKYELDIMTEANGSMSWDLLTREEREAMTEQERSIMDNYIATSKAYWEAKRIREQYFMKRSMRIVLDLLNKYGESIRVLDDELLQYLQERLSANLQH